MRFDYYTTDMEAFFAFMDEGIEICRYYFCIVEHGPPRYDFSWRSRKEIGTITGANGMMVIASGNFSQRRARPKRWKGGTER